MLTHFWNKQMAYFKTDVFPAGSEPAEAWGSVCDQPDRALLTELPGKRLSQRLSLADSFPNPFVPHLRITNSPGR